MVKLALDYAFCRGAGIYMYKIVSDKHGVIYKIGRAINIYKRLKTHSTSYPVGDIGVFRISKPEQNTRSYVSFVETIVHYIQKPFRVDKSREFFKIENMELCVETILRDIGCSVKYVSNEIDIRPVVESDDPEMHNFHIKCTLRCFKKNHQNYVNECIKTYDHNKITKGFFMRTDGNASVEMTEREKQDTWERGSAKVRAEQEEREEREKQDAWERRAAKVRKEQEAREEQKAWEEWEEWVNEERKSWEEQVDDEQKAWEERAAKVREEQKARKERKAQVEWDDIDDLTERIKKLNIADCESEFDTDDAWDEDEDKDWTP